MTCTTHHHACDCREQKVREMCEYLLAFDKSSNDGDVDTEWDSLEAAIDIANELYPRGADSAATGEPGRQPEAGIEAADR